MCIGLLCCVALRGQTVQTVPATAGQGVEWVLPTWQNFLALLRMDADGQAAVLQDCGYTALQPLWGYRRYSNTQDEFPSYLLDEHLFLCDTDEVRCIVSLNLQPLAKAVSALKEELSPCYIGEMPDEDGYRIDVYKVSGEGQDYEVLVTNRPMYFEISVTKR